MAGCTAILAITARGSMYALLGIAREKQTIASEAPVYSGGKMKKFVQILASSLLVLLLGTAMWRKEPAN
jgi:hypothetical protein